jgi:hypothetical protein
MQRSSSASPGRLSERSGLSRGEYRLGEPGRALEKVSSGKTPGATVIDIGA